MKLEALLLFCLLLILLFPHAAQGQEDRNYGSWSLYWENDYLAKTDSNYTNGGRLSWTSPWISWKPEGNSVPPGTTPWYHSLIKTLPFIYSPGHEASMFFLAGGQNIYTPDDTDRQDLIVDDRPYAGYLSTVIQQGIVALAVPLLTATVPIYNSMRVTVREAVSDYGIGGNSKPKEASVSKSALFIPRPMRLSLRNVFRRKLRLGLTLFSLVLGGAIFIGVYNLWASFDKTIHDVQGYFLADVNIMFDRNYRFDEVAPIAESVPGVTSVEGWAEVSGTLITNKDEAGKQIRFAAPPSTCAPPSPSSTSGCRR